MHFEQLLEQLSSLSQQEQGRLRLFVASPYFSKREKTEHLEALLAICLSALETPVERRPDKQAVYAALFPDAPFVRGKLEQRVRQLLYLSTRYMSLFKRTEPDEQLLHQFIQALREREHRLSSNEVKRAWTMARNIATHWQNLCKEKVYGRIYLEITLENLSRGLLHYNDNILHYTLESICKAALEMDLPELSYRVLSEHRGRIIGEPADEPFYRYNLARHQLYVGNLEEALDVLPHNMPDESYLLHLKVLEIQILYELNSSLLLYRMDALRLFIRRKGSTFFPPQRLLKARRFLNILARICRCPDGNIQRTQDIIAQIQNPPYTLEYYWLLRKTAEKESI